MELTNYIFENYRLNHNSSYLMLHANTNYQVHPSVITEADEHVLNAFNNKIEAVKLPSFADEFYSGGYIFIKDNGKAYDHWMQLGDNLTLREGWSSHKSLDPQHSYNSPLVGEMLFGTTELNGEKGSWVQLEAYSTNLTEWPHHMLTFGIHVITGQNVGPFGTSDYTEKKPLIISDILDISDSDDDILLNVMMDTAEDNQIISTDVELATVDFSTIYAPQPILQEIDCDIDLVAY
jgi:hypothetical protein